MVENDVGKHSVSTSNFYMHVHTCPYAHLYSHMHTDVNIQSNLPYTHTHEKIQYYTNCFPFKRHPPQALVIIILFYCCKVDFYI